MGGMGRLNKKTAGFIHVDSRRIANGRFGTGWYFSNPIAYSVPKSITICNESETKDLERGDTIGIVFIIEDGRVSTLVLENGQQYTGCLPLPLFDDAKCEVILPVNEPELVD